MRKWFAALLLLLCACGTVPNVTVKEVPSGGPISHVDDSLFQHTLERCLSETGTISITKLRADSDLTTYLEQIARMQTDAFSSRWQELAFWINAHNAYALDMIRSTPSAHSTSDIGGFHSARVALIGGASYSLDGIEHQVLAHKFREPRAFFALYDGTRSSPRLLEEPYNESHISDELDTQIHSFLADSTKNTLDKRGNMLYLSPIFRDYSEEIEKAAGSLTDFVKAFAPPALERWIVNHPSISIGYLSYDNTLNASDFEQPHEHLYRPPSRRSSGGIR